MLVGQKDQKWCPDAQEGRQRWPPRAHLAHLPASLPSHSSAMSALMGLSLATKPTSQPNQLLGKEQVPELTERLRSGHSGGVAACQLGCADTATAGAQASAVAD